MSMKFGKLLAAGRSLMRGHEAGRYQMRKGMALPQFISPKNPFKQEAAARPVAPPSAAAAPANGSACEFGTSLSQPVNSAESERAGGSLSVSGANISVSAANDSKTKSLSTLAKPAAVQSGVSAEAATQKKFWARFVAAMKTTLRWCGETLKRAALFCVDHNPFSAIGKPKLAGIPRFGKAPVQSELSLERVQVVRNDLAHADLEVVQSGGSK